MSDEREMRGIDEIELRIDDRINYIKNLKATMATNLFLHIDDVKKQILALNEIEHLCWVLNRPMPDRLYQYIK